MATATRVPQGDHAIPKGKELVGFEESVEILSADERFHATVYAMNNLLLSKGIYTHEEFRFLFRQSAQKQLAKRKKH